MCVLSPQNKYWHCQSKTACSHKARFVVSADAQSVPILQNLARDCSLGCHDVCPFPASRARFRRVKAPTSDELTHLTHTIAYRVARYLERQNLLVRDAGNSYLTAEGADGDHESPMNQLLGSSITYHIAMGPQQGRKVFTRQTLSIR